MSIKTDAIVIRDEIAEGANTAARVGQNLVDIADDLVAKQTAIDLNNAKETNIAHPLVETAVPIGAVFTDTDTIYNDADVLKDADTLSPVTGVNKLMTQDDIAGLGGGDMLATTYDPIINANTAKVGITTQQAADITANNAKVGVTTEEANPDVVGQAEAEAGTSTTERIWTAERVKQAIVALGGSGSVDDTAYGVSWNGVTGTAPSKNALYDFIESQVFKVDINSNISPIYWGGTQAEYDIDFPSGHPANYFVVITDGVPPETSASDVINVPSGNLVATNVQDALNEIQTEVDDNTAKVGVTAQMVSDINTNNLKVGVTTEEANTIDSEPIGNESQVLQVVSISQANYDLITPVATTLYVING